MLPTKDMNDGFTRLLERDQLHQLLVDVYPALADRIEVDDANPMLTIPTGHGGAVIMWKGESGGIIRWRLACPDGERVKVLEPASLEEFPPLVADALLLSRPAS